MTPRRVHTVHTVVSSPLGPLTLVATEGILCGLYLAEQRHPPAPASLGASAAATTPPFAAAADQLSAYFDGRLTTFDLPLTMAGTPFQRTVWAALRLIPYGETVSYREIAERIGRPTAARAVGLANGRNPISIVVPCHRVVGSAGELTGYGGGLDRKRWLLDFERDASECSEVGHSRSVFG